MKRKFTFFLACMGLAANAQNIYTVAGYGSNSYNGDNIPATTAGLVAAGAVAIDISGNMYIADMYNNRIRKVDAVTGIITTVAGTGTGGYNGDGIPAVTAQIYYPASVAVDKWGNIYIGDYSNNRIRKVDFSTGLISTIAGTGVYGYNGDNILAVNAKITEVTGLAVDSSGNVYFADMGNGRVRKIDVSSGMITTLAGTGGQGYNGDNIPGNTAMLYNPWGVALDTLRNVYIADKENNRIRKVDAITGFITTVAGKGVYNIYNEDGMPADSARFRYVLSVAVDDSGNIYIADQGNNQIHKVTKLTGIINTIAGTGTGGFSGDGGLATLAQLDDPRGVTVDGCGNVYIAIYQSQRIRKVFAYMTTPSVVNTDCYGNCNGSVSMTASGGAPPYTYSWSSGLGTGQTHTGLCAGTYTCTITDANGCVEQLPVTVNQPVQLTVSIFSVDATCYTDGAATANVSGGTQPYSYSWSTGATTPWDSSLSAGVYIVQVTDANGCTAVQNDTINNNPVPPPPVPLCVVTVDSTSSKNVIVWEKPVQGNLDSFRIYRYIGNVFVPIATVPYSAFSTYTDTTNGVNPKIQAYKYALTAIDTCGGESPLSAAHLTIHQATPQFTAPDIFDLSWTDYQGFNITQYYILRDGNNTGNWVKIDSVPYTNPNQYTDINAPSDSARYIIEASSPQICNPSFRIIPNALSTSYGATRSNTTDNLMSGIKETEGGIVLDVYPNPGSGYFTVSITGPGMGESEVEVVDLAGANVFSERSASSVVKLDLHALAKGNYFLHVKTRRGVANKMIVIE